MLEALARGPYRRRRQHRIRLLLGPIRWRPVVVPIFLLREAREARQGEDCND